MKLRRGNAWLDGWVEGVSVLRISTHIWVSVQKGVASTFRRAERAGRLERMLFRPDQVIMSVAPTKGINLRWSHLTVNVKALGTEQ